LRSNKALAIILAVVIVVLSIADYQLYHRGLVPGVKFDFQFTPSLIPDISVPIIYSAVQKTQTAPFERSNPLSSIAYTSESAGSSNQTETISKIGIYSNNPLNGTPQALETIDWSANGSIMPGQKVNSSKIYLRNEGTTPITLTFSASNWTFKNAYGASLPGNCSAYFTLTCDYDNSSIAVSETRPITFSLLISPSISEVSTFSFDLVIHTIT
jgi:hypothetical protein